MAKPRVFISSTFYDLRQIRADLDRFIQTSGYESVLNEKGNIPYGKDLNLEEYCYEEINNVDILIAIIGGRFGQHSSIYPDNSISQREIKTARELNKQVFVFIENPVYTEYRTYIMNKENSSIKYFSVDSIEIFKFIDWLHSLSNNNPIQGFDTGYDITSFLKEQWAGLFKGFLIESSKKTEINLFRRLESLTNTLENIVNFLSRDHEEKDLAIRDILLSSHPVFDQIRTLIAIKHRIYFTTKNELGDLLRSEYFVKINKIDPVHTFDTWYKSENERRKYLFIEENLFDNSNNLKIFSTSEWQKDFIRFEIVDDQANWPKR